MKPAFTDVRSNFADIKLRVQLNFLSLSSLAYLALNFLFVKRCYTWDSGQAKTERNHQEILRSLYAD